MYTGLLHLHNVLRWVILLLLVIAIIKALAGMSGRKAFLKGDRQVGTILMIFSHIQLLIGIYQWITGAWGLKLIQSQGMSGVMGESAYRFWAVEHAVGMLLAVILITIGRRQAKANISDTAKHKRSFWYFLLALVIIIATVPWPFREAIARPLFPGM